MLLFGIVLILIYVIGSALNSLCLLSIYKQVKDWTTNPGLIIIVSLAASDVLTTIPNSFASIGGVFGYTVHPAILFLLSLFHSIAWMVCSLTLILMALNRLIAIVFDYLFDIVFSPRMTFVYCLSVWGLALLYSVISQLIGCAPVWDSHMIVALYMNRTHHYCRLLITAPVSALTTALCTVCYTAIAVKLILSKAGFSQSVVDLHLCWQFLLVIAAYGTMVTTWNVVPAMAAESDKWQKLFYSISFATAVNYTINPVIYLLFNKTIKKAVRQTLHGCCCASGVAVEPHPQRPIHNHQAAEGKNVPRNLATVQI